MGGYNHCYYMAYKTKVRKIGNSLGIVLPKEALQAMKAEEGATLYHHRRAGEIGAEEYAAWLKASCSPSC